MLECCAIGAGKGPASAAGKVMEDVRGGSDQLQLALLGYLLSRKTNRLALIPAIGKQSRLYRKATAADTLGRPSTTIRLAAKFRTMLVQKARLMLNCSNLLLGRLALPPGS